MARRRVTLAHLMVLVLYAGFGFAALRNADELWASATYTLAIVLIASALVGAFARSGRARMPWVGFAVFGWTYLVIAHLPGWPIGGLGFGPIDKPVLLVEWATAQLHPYIMPAPQRAGVGTASYFWAYEKVSQALGIILFGFLGAAIGLLLGPKEQRPNHGSDSETRSPAA